MSSTSKRKVVTGKVRFSYVNVFEPRSIGENDPKFYDVCILIPKSDKKGIAKLEAAIEAAAEAGASKWGGKPKKLKLPLRDGDEEKDLPEFEGMLFLNAKSARKPQVVDEDLNPIMDKDDFYSGCWGRASIDFYPYDYNGSKGIACGLNNLQKLEDGERLGGDFSSAEDDFGDDLM
jgi:hypothetical protein